MPDKSIDWDMVDPQEIPTSKLKDNRTVQEILQEARLAQDLEKEVTLPYTVEDITLMSPGVWNNYEYTPSAIKKAYKQTNWDDKEIKSIFWAHKDADANTWIGEIVNPRLEGNKIKGDLKIVDKAAAIKLAYGAKFGISPKVTGDVNRSGVMQEFSFDNFSAVLNPAIKTAYINNMEVTNVTEESDKPKEDKETEEAKKVKEDKEVKEEKEVSENEEETPEEESEEPEETEDSEEGESEEEDTETEENSELDIDELADKILAKFKKYPKKYPGVKKYPAKPPKGMEKSGLSEEEKEDLSAYTDFVKKMKKEHPDMSFKEISKKWKEKKKSASEMVDETKKELDKEIENKEEQIKELSEKVEDLSEKVNKPKRVSKKTGELSEKKPKAKDWSNKQADAGMLVNMLRNQGSGHLVPGGDSE